MRVHGDYHGRGYAHIEGLLPNEVADGLLQLMEADLAAAGMSFQSFAQQQPLTRRPSVDISSHQYRPLMTFLWGLTPLMAQLTGRDLLPTYDYFRIYQKGDICRVHSDRPSCEHSLSLTLGYSDGAAWPLEIGSREVDRITGPDETFEDEPHGSVPMAVGDAVLYQGARYRHGRTESNPNGWSAHLFLHWVDRDGPHKDHAFDARRPSAQPA